MTDQPKVYPDSRDGLTAMLIDCDAGFGLYKRQHWVGQIRDVIGPWLDAHDEEVRKRALHERESQMLDRTTPKQIPVTVDAGHARTGGEISTVTCDDVEGEPQEIRVDRTAPHEVVITHLDGGIPRGWLYVAPELASSLGQELSGIAPVRVEYRAIYPQSLTADSNMTNRVFEDEEDAEGLVEFINRRLTNWELPSTAAVETRELFAGEWTRRN